MEGKMKALLYGVIFALILWQSAAGAEDFPSFRTFGPYAVVGGKGAIEAPLVMGPTGAMGWLHGSEFMIWEVDKGSPADGILQEGDVILKANGHGLGVDPRMGLGYAVAESEAGDGKFALTIYRDGKEQDVVIQLQKLGEYSKTWPFHCDKSRQVLDIFCSQFAAIQETDGGFTFRTASSANGLALLANEDPKYLENARRLAYSYVRDKVSAGEQGTWPSAYTGIYLAEYYLVTGDRHVLPELERVCKILAEGQQPCGSWGHGSHISRYYAVGGLVNQCGIAAWLAMVLGKHVGVEVDQEALDRAAEFFGTFADRGNVPYGDHRPWDGGSGNGKDGIASVAFDILGDKEKSGIFADYITQYYSHREEGHTGPYFGFLWGPLGALRTTNEEDFHRLMNYWIWYYDLARNWEGAGLLFSGDTYMKRGFRFCSGAIAMPYALSTGHKRLRIMGAPDSVFIAGEYSSIIGQARQLFFEQKWDDMEKLLAGEDDRYATQLLEAAQAARKSVELTIAGVEENLKKGWNPPLAIRQLEDLKAFLVNDDARVDKLLEAANDAERFRAISEAEEVYKKYVHLSCVDDTARAAMEQIANDPAAGYVSELAQKDLLETPDTYRYVFFLEGEFYRFRGRWKEDDLAFKGFKRIATVRGGEWPQWVSRDEMREAGYLLYEKETLDNWTEILPISGKDNERARPKDCRVLFLAKEETGQVPAGWYMPEFDDSQWQEGQFPVGTFHDDRSRAIFPGDARYCYIRMKFNAEEIDFTRLRILPRIRHIANVYLNGHMIARFVYDGNEGGYKNGEPLDLHPEAPRLLKPGENVLAIEGTYNLWWGIFDVGLFGTKEEGAAVLSKEPVPPPVVYESAPVSDDERFKPKDIWKERQEQMDKLSVPELMEKLESEYVHIRGHAARSLAKKGKEATPHLIKALKHPHWHVRRGACDAIKWMEEDAAANASDALPILIETLDDTDFWVRDGAALAIAAIGKVPQEIIPRLVEMLDDKDHWWPREAAAKAIKSEADGVLPGLIAAYSRTTNVRTELTLRDIIRRRVTAENSEAIISQITDLIQKDSDWFRQKIMLELVKTLGPKAKDTAPLLKDMIQKAGDDNKKVEYLQDVAKAVERGD